jgi:hypothetical protein
MPKQPPKPKGPTEPAILKRKLLLAMLDAADKKLLTELYQQVMGVEWKHGVAELGDAIRQRMKARSE